MTMLPLRLMAVLAICSVQSSWSASSEPAHIKLTLGEVTNEQTASCDSFTYYSVVITEPCMDLRITVKHIQGQPDLYVSKYPNKYPTLQSLAWSSYEWNDDVLVISSWDPEFTVGTYYIGVHTYCGEDVHTGDQTSRFTLIAESIATTHPHEEITLNGDVSSMLPAEEYKYYRFCLPTSCSNLVVELQNCIDPAACPTTYAWPELLLSRSIERPSINDHAWKLASIEKRSIDISHSDPDFYPGHYFVGVYGWCTQQDNCPDKSTCGPCDYADNHPFTVSVTVEEVTSGCTPKQSLEVCEGGTSFIHINMPLLVILILFAVVLKRT